MATEKIRKNDAWETIKDNATTTGNIDITLNGTIFHVPYRKRAGIVEFGGDFGVNMTGWDNNDSGIGTLPEALRPLNVKYFPVMVLLDVNSWASATYYTAVLQINANGTMQLWGHLDFMKRGKDVNMNIIYSVNY